MIEAARLGVIVSAEGVDETKRKLEGFGGGLSSLGVKAGVAGGILTATVTRSLLGMGDMAVTAASDVVESMNKVDVVFGGSAGVVKQFADTAATSIGLSEQAALDAAGTMGNMYVQLGVSGDKAATFSQQMMVAASDLASFHNAAGGTEEVLGTMQSAFRGEYDAIQRYIPTINAAAVEQMALAMTGKTVTKELTATEKAMAAQAIILQNLGPAAGDFLETSDGLANSQRIVQSSMQDLAATIGMQLLPYKLQLVHAVQQLLMWFQNLDPGIQQAVIIFGVLAAVVGPLLIVLGTLAGAVAAIGAPVLLVVGAIGLLAAAWATNFGGIRDVTMPIIEQIQAWFGEVIPAAIAKFQEIWGQLVAFFEPTVQRIRDAVGPMVESFSPLGEKIAAVWAIVEPVLSALANIIVTVVVVAFNLLLEIVAAVMPSIGTIIGNAIDIALVFLQTLSTVVTEVVATIKDLLEGDFSGAWEHVQNIFETLKEAVITIFGKIADTILTVIKDLITAFTNWYDSLSKNSEFVRNTLTPVLQTLASLMSGALKGAVDTVTGVFNGLKGAIDAVGGAVNSVIGWLANLQGKLSSLKLPAWLTPGSPTPFEYGLIGINEALQATSMQGLPEFSDAMTVLGEAVDGALGVFSGIGSMEAINDLPGRMNLFKDQIVEIIRELASLAGQMADMPQGGNWVSAKAGMDAAMTVLGPLLTSLDTIKGLGDMKLLSDIPARVAFIKEAILALVEGVAEMANSPEMAGLAAATTTGTGLSAFGKAIEGVFGPLREAAKAWETIKGFNFSDMNVGPVLSWLASFGTLAVNALAAAQTWVTMPGEGFDGFIKSIGTAVKGLAEVAKAWETLQGFVKSSLGAGGAAAMVQWLASLGAMAVNAMTWASSWAQAGPGLEAFATAVKNSLGGLVDVARAWETLQKFVPNSGKLPMQAIVEWLASLGGLAVTALQRVAGWSQFNTLDAKMTEVAGYMQSAFGAMSAAVQFTNELGGWKELPDLEGKFDRLRRAIEYIVPQFELTRIAVGTLAYEEVAKFAQALADIAGGIEAALDLLQTDMSDLAVPQDTFWEPLNDWIQKTFASFARWIAANPNLGEQSPMVTAFGDAVGSLFGGLRSAVDVAASLPKDWAPPADSVWIPFTNWVKAAFESFYTYVTTQTGLGHGTDVKPDTERFTGGGLDLVGKFGSALAGLMGGLKSALELAMNLPTNWTAPDAAMWDSFTGWVKKVFDNFLAWVQRTHTDENGNQIPFDTIGLDLVTAFGSALGALMQGLASSFAVFSGLVGFVAPSEAQFAAFKTAVTKVFTDFTAYAKGLETKSVEAVKAFGEAMGSLFGGLNTALTFTSAVYKESPKFFEFLASASAGAGGDFQVKMGLIMYAITETMSRFKTNVVDKVKTDWLPAAGALLKAVQDVFGVLNTALNIFRDLNTVGMPSSKTITDFVDAVLLLFSKLTTGLGLAPGEVDKAGGGVKSTLAAWEKVISQDATNWYNLGYAFGGMFAAGWGTSMQNQAKAGSFMLNSTYMVTEAIKNAIKTAFGIASPSKVMMGYGDLMAQGLGLGLDKGMQALGLPGMDGRPMQFAYAGVPQQVVRVQVTGDIGLGGQRVSPAEADEIARALVRTMRLKA